jgi:hypothetical protein
VTRSQVRGLIGISFSTVGPLCRIAPLPSGLDRWNLDVGDYALAIAAFLLLFMLQTPPWLVVVLCAVGGSALSYF